jgi:hypothetical protein
MRPTANSNEQLDDISKPLFVATTAFLSSNQNQRGRSLLALADDADDLQTEKNN